MKWIWLALLGVAAPLLVLLAITLTLYRPGLPIAAQKSLAVYLAQQAEAGQPLRVQTVMQAAHRSALTADLSAATFGSSYYFHEDGRAAPYPPTDLWCVTLIGASAPTTVFVAQHEDMYVGAWLVHAPASTQAVAAICE